MATVTATPDPTTGSVLVQVEQTTLRDLFTRAVANSWGNATTGQVYSTAGSGVAANYNVNGTQGTHTMTTTGAARISFATPFATPDHGYFIQSTVPVAALTQPILIAAMARYSDAGNHYFAEVSLAPSGVATLSLRKATLGVVTSLASVVLGQVHVAGATWNIGIEACGTTIRAKAWRSTVAEPGWLITVNDSDQVTGVATGVRTTLTTGNTNASPIIAYDNAYAYVSQPVRVVRVTPDGVESEVRGSPLNTNSPTAAAATATATLWDNESPFDTDLVYRLYSNCNPTTVVASSATVELVSDGVGWLRDPTQPTRNIAITMEDFYDECIDQDVVVFSGLGDPEYANASGQFDIIGAQRPRTVSQVRKNYASSLTLTSFSLDDILDLEDIYAPGSVLALTLPTLYGWANRTYGTDYITIGDIVQTHIGVDQRVTSRVWTVPFRLSGPPVDTDSGGTGGNGIGGGGATYDELADSVLGTTYNTLTASGQIFDQVAAGVGY